MKQYLQTIMRSLCIMLMLCGMSNGTWAQSDWSEVFQLENSGDEENPGENGSDNPYIIENWDDFVNTVSSISTSDVYFKLNTDVTIDQSSDSWTPISGFEGYFDGNNQYVYMKNCTFETSTLFDGEEGLISEDHVSNISYQYTFTTYQGLKELSDHITEWPTLSHSNQPSFNINTTDGDIEIEDEDWEAIDDSSVGLQVSVSGKHFIVFPSTSVYQAYTDMNDDSHIFLLTSESGFELSLYTYKELTIDEETDVTVRLSSNETLCQACKNLTLTKDLDLTGITSDLGITFGGTFNQGEYTITMPGFKASEKGLEVFSDVEGVTYTYENIRIEDDNDYSAFIDNQDALLAICKDVYVSNEITVGAEDYTPFKSDFSVTSSAGCSIILEINSQTGFEKILGNMSSLTGDLFKINLYNKNESSSDWYDYSFTSKDLTDISSVDINNDLSDDVIILLTDKSSGNEPFSGNEHIKYFYTPSNELVDILFHNALSDPYWRGKFFTEHEDEDDHSIDVLSDFAGHGTVYSPYLIYTYGMLKKLVEIVNAADEDYTSGMYIQLASDINVQGNERLTGVDGQKIIDSPIENVQFTNAFKGHFDGNKHSIGGLTQPLFSSLDNATITNLGIVDCNMSAPALAESATGANISMSYVSGVSNGLISEEGNTVENCYAWNTSTKENTTYSLTAATVDDISGTHQVLEDNSYKLDTDKYSDCTLFIPEDNTFYEVSPSNEFFTWSSDQNTYMYYINWEDDFVWIDNPVKSNVSMLHNVLYRDGWLNNNEGVATNVGGLGSLDYLYSWYIVDKKACNVSALEKSVSNDYAICCRVKNIYYSRNNSTTTSPAPDGLNTIYLPFAWNPATDLYDADGNLIDDATVHILADKLTESGDGYEFNDEALYKDYSMEKSLLFFDPANDVDDGHVTKYDNFAGVSNALPTLLNIPSGKNGWYIKRSELANYFTPRNSDGYYWKDADDADGLDNLYNNYWEDQNPERSKQKIGRSFMEIDRLGEEWPEFSDQSYYTYSFYHSLDDMSSCDYQLQVTEMNRDEKEVYDSGNSSTVTIYKAYESSAIAVDGSTYPIKIKCYDEDSNEVILYETDSDDRIVLDSDGYPAILYASDENDKVIIDSSSSSIEVCSSDGNGGYASSGETKYVEFEFSNYPLTFSVCGGHEDGVWADQDGVSDFPGRAYHLGTFTGITAETFNEGKLASNTDYSCYKLNSAGTGFAKVTSSSTVQPFRTFFAISKGAGDINTGTPSLAKAYRLGFCGIYDGTDINDTPTSIDGAPVEGIHLMTTGESKIYSIDGRYVGQYGNKKLAPGMYIMNGKKFVVK